MNKSYTQKYWFLSIAMASFLVGCGPSKGDIESKMQAALSGECKVKVTKMEELLSEKDVEVSYKVNGNSVSVNVPVTKKRYVVEGEIEYLVDEYKFAVDSADSKMFIRETEVRDDSYSAELKALRDEVANAEKINASISLLSAANSIRQYAAEIIPKRKSPASEMRAYEMLTKKLNDKASALSRIGETMREVSGGAEFRDAAWLGATRDALRMSKYEDLLPNPSAQNDAVENRIREKIEEIESFVRGKVRARVTQPEEALPRVVSIAYRKGEVVPFSIRVAEVSSGGKTRLIRDFASEGIFGAQSGSAFELASALAQATSSTDENKRLAKLEWGGGFRFATKEQISDGIIIYGSAEWRKLMADRLSMAKKNIEELSASKAECEAFMDKTLNELKEEYPKGSVGGTKEVEKKIDEISLEMDSVFEKCKALVDARKESLPASAYFRLGYERKKPVKPSSKQFKE